MIFFYICLQMLGRSVLYDKQLRRSFSALFFVLLVGFSYSAEVFHHHDHDKIGQNQDSDSSTGKFDSTCFYCDLMQHNRNAVDQLHSFIEIEPAFFYIESSSFKRHSISFHSLFLLGFSNKSPPMLFS